MITVSFYDEKDGIFVGRTYSGDVDSVVANTPIGCKAIEGLHDRFRRRVDMETGQVVSWQPPRPADDALQTWDWSASDECWISIPTLAAVARDVRARRTSLLNDCDWVVTQAFEDGTPVPVLWRKYRKALRDIPTQPGFPATVIWPVPPA